MGLTATTALSSVVLAADPVVDYVNDWSGFYIGGHVGYGEANYEGCIECTDGSDILDAGELDLSGVAGGIHGGFNHQFDSFVIGIEGDLTWTGFEDNAVAPSDNDYHEGEVDLLGHNE